MIRKVGLIVLASLILGIPINAKALDERPPWKVLDEALTYLHGVPEVAWVKFVGENMVAIGWERLPKNFAQINKTAARNAAHALHSEVLVVSFPPGETTLSLDFGHHSGFPFLCETLANPREIVKSNCR